MANEKQIHAKLKAAQKSWSSSEEKRPESQLEDGDYIAKPAEMRIDVAKSGRLQCVTKWQVTEGSSKGGSIRRYDGLDDEVGMSYFKGYAAILGLEVPDAMSDLPEAVEDFVENNADTYKMSVRTQKDGDFKNVYINGLADGGEGLDQEEDEKKSAKKTSASKKKDLEEDDDGGDDGFDFEEGQEVTITLKSGKSVSGTVSEVTETTVTVEDDNDDAYEIKLARIESVEERKKKKPAKRK